MQMIFEENKEESHLLCNPFSELQMGIAATKIDVKEQQPEGLDISIDYALEINAEHAADCRISVNVRQKDAGEFSL